MAKVYEHTYTVEGSGPLPLDMLRYDRSYPATEEAAGLAENDRTRRRVKLGRLAMTRNWVPEGRRWLSFGWAVVEWGDPRVVS